MQPVTLEWKCSELPGVDILCRRDALAYHRDHRGVYREIYNEKAFHEGFQATYSAKYGGQLTPHFVQDDISTSRYGTLRGLHGDTATWKLVTCLVGGFYLVVVNNDKNAHLFRRWVGIYLNEDDGKSVLIPPNHANGHLVTAEAGAVFHYKQSTYYAGMAAQFTLAWNDPELRIWWPMPAPLWISERDDQLGSIRKEP